MLSARHHARRNCSFSESVEFLEVRNCLDTSLSVAIPLPSMLALSANFRFTQAHDSQTPPLGGLFTNVWWYGQTGDKTDGSFAKSGQTVDSMVKIWGGSSAGQCNSLLSSPPLFPTTREGGEVVVTATSMPPGLYQLRIGVEVNWMSIGPSTNYAWQGTLLGGTAVSISGSPGSFGPPVGNSLSYAHGNPPLLGGASPSTFISNSGMDSAQWIFDFAATAAGLPAPIFRWIPTLSHTGAAATDYLRQTAMFGKITISVISVPPLPMPIIPVTAVLGGPPIGDINIDSPSSPLGETNTIVVSQLGANIVDAETGTADGIVDETNLSSEVVEADFVDSNADATLLTVALQDPSALLELLSDPLV